MKVHRAAAYIWLVIMTIAMFISIYASGKDSSQPRYDIMNSLDENHISYSFSIQQAINDAPVGAEIVIPSGTYYEHLTINKTISLIAENRFEAIIDGSGSGTVLEITADNVTISGFVLQNSGYGWTRHGIYVYKADHCVIENNHLLKDCHNIRLNYSRNSVVRGNTIDGVMTQPTMYGIRVENSINCTIEANHISDCVGAIHLQNATACIVSRNLLDRNSQGIRFYTPCTYNEVFENNVYNNSYDGMISIMPDNITLSGNRIFHNNFINNSSPFIGSLSGIAWDSGYPHGGNYWSLYDGVDLKSGYFQNETDYDGIGDGYYSPSLNQKDSYPLMHPYGSVVNTDTKDIFLTIASALASNKTMDGHAITVKAGVYHEHITLDKTVALLGENRSCTIIDGDGFGTVAMIRADNVSFSGFTVRNSGSKYPPYGNDCGLLLNHSSGSIISSNAFIGNRIGVYLLFSGKNSLEDNIAHSNLENGIWLWHSGNNMLRRNTMFNNTYNFGVFGYDFEDFDNNIDMTNKIEEKPICYVIGEANRVFDASEPISTLYLINCVNVSVRHLDLTGNGQGICCYNLTYSRIENLTTSENNYGIDLLESSNNLLSGNRCKDNWVGIRIERSDNNTLEGNMLTAGEKGISMYDTSFNCVEGNTFEGCMFGIRLSIAHSNQICRNNFIQNSAQADLVSSNQNVWDNGVEGNYWSDHANLDEDRNGIADNKYSIDAQNSDNYPLSGLYNKFETESQEGSNEVAIVSNSAIRELVYDDVAHAIILTVEGTNDTLGFCRIRVPYALIEPELRVIIDDGLTDVTYANYNLLDNGIYRWIYFEYRHSVHQIVVVTESQEFGLWLLLATLGAGMSLLLKGFERQKVDATMAHKQ